MTVNMNVLFVIAGLCIGSMIIEKVLSKGGNETGAMVVGLVTTLIGFGIVFKLFMGLLGEIGYMFFSGGM